MSHSVRTRAAAGAGVGVEGAQTKRGSQEERLQPGVQCPVFESHLGVTASCACTRLFFVFTAAAELEVAWCERSHSLVASAFHTDTNKTHLCVFSMTAKAVSDSVF